MSQTDFKPGFDATLPAAPTSGKASAALILGLLSFLFTCLAGIPAIVLGVLAYGDVKRSQGKLRGSGLATTGIVLSIFGMAFSSCGILLVPALLSARQAQYGMVSQNNLKLIGLAMHNYHDIYKTFPLPGSEDPTLGINRSWRVSLLPYLEQGPLFDQYNHHQPWDSAANAKLQNLMPKNYLSPPSRGGTETAYLTFTSADHQQPAQPGNPVFGFGANSGIGISAVRDGTANTLLAVEADPDRAVPWMKPVDLVYDSHNPKSGLGHRRPGGFNAVLVDGSVRFISNNIDDEVLRRLIMRDDGLPVTVD